MCDVMPKPITLLDDRQWPAAGFLFELPIRPESTALGVIDVQHYATDTDGHMAHTVQRFSPELQAGFQNRCELMMVNIERLLKLFRHHQRRSIVPKKKRDS